MADNEHMRRKVYLLPSELVERIRAYQVSAGLPSEVEAARRLLDMALQAGESAKDLLHRLSARHATQRDLRALAREVLTGHPQVTTIQIEDTEVAFTLRNGERGSINSSGEMGYAGQNDHDALSYYSRPAAPPPARKG